LLIIPVVVEPVVSDGERSAEFSNIEEMFRVPSIVGVCVAEIYRLIVSGGGLLLALFTCWVM
jgi:hypothetical protein